MMIFKSSSQKPIDSIIPVPKSVKKVKSFMPSTRLVADFPWLPESFVIEKNSLLLMSPKQKLKVSSALNAKKRIKTEDDVISDFQELKTQNISIGTFQRSRDDKNGKSDRKCFRCGDLNHLIGQCPKPPRDKNQRAFVGGSWSDSGEEDDEKVNNEACLVAQTPNEVNSRILLL
ncbi:alpha/beta hydrolases superfamily protein [Tanacetum coccineum]